MARRKKNDKQSIGLLLGFLLPLIVLLVLFYIRYQDVQLIEVLVDVVDVGLFLKILSLCVFPNLILFMYYIRMKMDRAARGVVGATLIYAILILISKLI